MTHELAVAAAITHWSRDTDDVAVDVDRCL